MNTNALCLFLIVIFCHHDPVIGLSDKNETDDSLEDRVKALETVVSQLLTGRPNGLSNITMESLAAKADYLQRANEKAMFYAFRGGDVSGINTGFIIKFDNVVTNVGGNYYPQDGIFIAPYTGVYMFHWQFITCNGNRAYSELRVDGSTKGKSYSDDRTYDTTANMVVVEVRQKQHVWIQTFSSSMCLNDYSSFSGVLLSPS